MSAFGAYERPVHDRIDGRELESSYVAMSDGIRLAMDLWYPTSGGRRLDERATVLRFSRYPRNRSDPDGRTAADSLVATPYDGLVDAGYVVAVVEARGTNASEGVWDGPFSGQERDDLREVIEWLASQDWSNGAVGMAGGSYDGISSLLATTVGAEALKAVFPMSSGYDMYRFIYPGGVLRDDFVRAWQLGNELFDTGFANPALGVTPSAFVDEDPDGRIASSARSDRSRNLDVDQHMREHALRSKIWTTPQSDGPTNPAAHIDEINASGVPIYWWAGWYDVYAGETRDVVENLTVPLKVAVGPWEHFPEGARADAWYRFADVELLRWFDHWLYGVDNGVMDEPMVNYAVVSDVRADQWHWCQAGDWPEQDDAAQFVVNGDELGVAPLESPQVTHGTVDLTATTGRATRWWSGTGTPVDFAELVAPSSGIAWESAPFIADTTFVGHPQIELFLTSTAPVLDLHLYLELVGPDGATTYLTEGVLRTAHRAIASPPWQTLDELWHPSTAKAVRATTLRADKATHVGVTLDPVSQLVRADDRLRLTLAFADVDNTETPPGAHGAHVSVRSTPRRPSTLALPIRDECGRSASPASGASRA